MPISRRHRLRCWWPVKRMCWTAGRLPQSSRPIFSLREKDPPGTRSRTQQQRLSVQPVHPAGQRFVCARYFRPESPHGGVGAGAGTGVRFQMIATHITLEHQRGGHVVQEASLQAQIDATRQLIDINTNMLQILQYQFDQGLCQPARCGRAGIAARANRRHAAAADQAAGPAARCCWPCWSAAFRMRRRRKTLIWRACSCRRICR
jgi:hypothetical protein